jgi:crossover junction endodeoxyribonuclease RuvC
VVILGLDPGIAATGYGIVEARGGRLRALDSGVVRTTPREPYATRLATIHAAIALLVREHAADEAAIEEVYVGPDPRATLALGQARGAALAACGAAGLRVAEYPVATVKAAVCGYGRAEKGQVGRMVRVLLSLEAAPRNEHEADALAAALCHAQRARLERAVGGRA